MASVSGQVSGCCITPTGYRPHRVLNNGVQPLNLSQVSKGPALPSPAFWLLCSHSAGSVMAPRLGTREPCFGSTALGQVTATLSGVLEPRGESHPRALLYGTDHFPSWGRGATAFPACRRAVGSSSHRPAVLHRRTWSKPALLRFCPQWQLLPWVLLPAFSVSGSQTDCSSQTPCTSASWGQVCRPSTS